MLTSIAYLKQIFTKVFSSKRKLTSLKTLVTSIDKGDPNITTVTLDAIIPNAFSVLKYSSPYCVRNNIEEAAIAANASLLITYF